MSERESAFLWSVYASMNDGVCVRSTVGKLKESLALEPRDLFIGPVEYIDYETELIEMDNILNPFYRKRKSFESERELRATFLHLLPGIAWMEKAETENPKGISVPCDLSILIDEILVPPNAPQWHSSTVFEVLSELGHAFHVNKSPLSGPAIF